MHRGTSTKTLTIYLNYRLTLKRTLHQRTRIPHKVLMKMLYRMKVGVHSALEGRIVIGSSILACIPYVKI